ncbi:MAG: glycosyltransferase family 4 protein [Gammaproteobacteria bacterium]|nr:glycosyltransferase family 4 protein [Gammaproteobacteria bacterium]
MRASAPLRLCVVAHHAYGAMTGGTAGHFGGVERQTSLMCRWLAARGHDVSLVSWDEGQGDDMRVDGVRLIRLCRRDAGLPGLRFFAPRWTSLLAALRRADATVYYHNCAEYVTGQVAHWCRRNGRHFVYSVASDMDVDPALPDLPARRERLLYRYGLKAADRIVLQTEVQRQRLQQHFGLAGVVLPMPCPGPDAIAYQAPQSPVSGAARVLWAGRIAPVKRFELLLEVARACPEIGFDVAGMLDADDGYLGPLLIEARRLPNLQLHGAVPRARMAQMYARAALLLCTSRYEGFPNTFIEAWSLGVPVVSTIDPDGLILARQLGGVGSDAAGLAAAIRTLIADPAEWRASSGRARDYYQRHHAVDPAMGRFEQLFREVVG